MSDYPSSNDSPWRSRADATVWNFFKEKEDSQENLGGEITCSSSVTADDYQRVNDEGKGVNDSDAKPLSPDHLFRS